MSGCSFANEGKMQLDVFLHVTSNRNGLGSRYNESGSHIRAQL